MIPFMSGGLGSNCFDCWEIGPAMGPLGFLLCSHVFGISIKQLTNILKHIHKLVANNRAFLHTHRHTHILAATVLWT